MTITVGAQYRPGDMAATVAGEDMARTLLSEHGASDVAFLYPLAGPDVGTAWVRTTWNSLSDYSTAMDPTDGTAPAAMAADPDVAALLANAGPVLNRMIADVEYEVGESSGKYIVQATGCFNAGDADLRARAVDVLASLLGDAASGVRLSRAAYGAPLNFFSVAGITDDLAGYDQALAAGAATIGEWIGKLEATDVVRVIHRMR